jgi:hypothetical protein
VNFNKPFVGHSRIGVSIPCPFFNPGIPGLTYANPGISGLVPGLKIFSYTSLNLSFAATKPCFDGKMDGINEDLS